MSLLESITYYFPTFLILLATGAFAGTLAGLLGAGGGIIIVPVLFFLLQGGGVSPESAMPIATATSLATIIPTSISSIRAHRKKGNIDFHLLKLLAPFILFGVLAGSWLVTRVDGIWLTLFFGVIAILSALNILLRTGKSALFQELPKKAGQSVIGTVIGFFSVMVGIGGGTIAVPIFTIYNYPVHKAVGTSAAIGLIISLPGALTMLIIGSTPPDAPASTYGLVYLGAFLCIVPLTVLFAPVGAALAAKLNATRLRQLFAIVLFITGIRMLLQFFL